MEHSLSKAGLTEACQIPHYDEMRVGVWEYVRRCQGRKGARIIRIVQIKLARQRQVLAVDVARRGFALMICVVGIRR